MVILFTFASLWTGIIFLIPVLLTPHLPVILCYYLYFEMHTFRWFSEIAFRDNLISTYYCLITCQIQFMKMRSFRELSSAQKTISKALNSYLSNFKPPHSQHCGFCFFLSHNFMYFFLSKQEFMAHSFPEITQIYIQIVRVMQKWSWGKTWWVQR